MLVSIVINMLYSNIPIIMIILCRSILKNNSIIFLSLRDIISSIKLLLLLDYIIW